MAKKMKKLEKECQSWKTRFDACNKNLIDMVADVRCNISHKDLVSNIGSRSFTCFDQNATYV